MPASGLGRSAPWHSGDRGTAILRPAGVPAHPRILPVRVRTSTSTSIILSCQSVSGNLRTPGVVTWDPRNARTLARLALGVGTWTPGSRDSLRSSSGHLIMIDGTEGRWGRCPRYRYRCAGGSLSAQRQGQVHGRETRDGGGGGEGSTEASKPAEEGCGRHSNLSLDMEWTRD